MSQPNTADPQAVKVRNRRERRGRERELADIKFVMSTVEGRRFVWRLMSQAGIYKTSMTGNSYTYFQEGARNLGLVFFNDVMEACPELYLMAQEEAKKTQKRDDDAERAMLPTPEKEDSDG